MKGSNNRLHNKAGLLLTTEVVKRCLRCFNYQSYVGNKIDDASLIYITGFIECLIKEILELSGNYTLNKKKKIIQPETIVTIIEDDNHLSKIFNGAKHFDNSKLCYYSGDHFDPYLKKILNQLFLENRKITMSLSTRSNNLLSQILKNLITKIKTYIDDFFGKNDVKKVKYKQICKIIDEYVRVSICTCDDSLIDPETEDCCYDLIKRCREYGEKSVNRFIDYKNTKSNKINNNDSKIQITI